MKTKQVRTRIRIAKKYGFTLKRHKKHLVFQNDQGKVVVCPKTSKHWNCDKDFERQLHRYSLSA